MKILLHRNSKSKGVANIPVRNVCKQETLQHELPVLLISDVT